MGALPPGSAVLAGHPDDELVGAAVLLARLLLVPRCGPSAGEPR